jgi:hypothetical protein
MDEDDELPLDDDEIDGLFDWAISTFNSGGIELSDYTATLKGRTIKTVSDGITTITFEVPNDPT